ncbi:MAG TPA: DNA polymerase III subunit beta, partial [Gammaproteobacteria bacterium]|nr:DNA polymerase III subunit beta [Gammaproteobacteria bacterium]
MKFQVQRETFLKPIQAVTGVVERRQTMPILSNLLLSLNDGNLAVTATDLEVELQSTVALDGGESGDITVPGRKLLDICKALPDNAQLDISYDKNRLTVRSGKSRFTLSTLPAAEFPLVEDINTQVRFSAPQNVLKRLLDKTQFAMAQQDVRYYLNGLLLELRDKGWRAVATDGHRMALTDAELDGVEAGMQIIVPRKGVLELQRLLSDSDDPVDIEIGSNHIRVRLAGQQFTSKLIDGRFPEYERVIPAHSDKLLQPARQGLREALQRTAILSNEKYRGVRLALSNGTLKLQAHNPEQEEAEEEIALEYQ